MRIRVKGVGSYDVSEKPTPMGIYMSVYSLHMGIIHWTYGGYTKAERQKLFRKYVKETLGRLEGLIKYGND